MPWSHTHLKTAPNLVNVNENIVWYSLLFTLQIAIISRSYIINKMTHFRMFSIFEIRK